MKTVIIRPPDGGDGDLQPGYGTKVLTPDGADIPGIRSIDIRIRPDEAIEASLEMYVWFAEFAPVPGWYAHDPESGQVRKIKNIVWDDGGTFVA